MNSTDEQQARLQREAAFHDQTFAADSRETTDKFYATAATSKAFYRQRVLSRPNDKRVLEYGCGTGSCAFDLAVAGANVTAIDISPVALEIARTQAERLGITNVSFALMNAEQLTFENGTFDSVCGSGILHHLDVAKSCFELHRVLKVGGTATFYEPLGHNPLINLYRSRTPALRTPDEHPLLRGDLSTIQGSFPQAEFSFFHCTTLAAVPFRNTRAFGPLLTFTTLLDRLLLSPTLPTKYLAWIVVIHIVK